MKFFDFFAGIGGFRLGMEMAGHECVGHCEIDEYALKSYKAMHNPSEDEVIFGDIRTVKPGDMPEADCYCFGFPCQSFSIAGKRGGFDDTRGTLFFEVMRLAAERKPSVLFGENVKGLLNHDGGRTFDTIIRTMDALGYEVEWQLLNSKDFGVPQNRERVFIIGHLREESGGRKVFPIRDDGGETHVVHGQQDRQRVVAGTLDTRIDGDTRGTYVMEDGNILKVQGYHKDNVRVVAGLGEKKSNGGTQWYQQDRIYDIDGIAPSLMQGKSDLMILDDLYADRPTRAYTDISPTLRAGRSGLKIMQVNPNAPHQQDRVYSSDGLSPSLNTVAGGNLEPKVIIGSTQEHAPRRTDGISPTLTSAMGEGGGHVPMIPTGVRIRKLTPKECFRLQGFPDEYFERAASVCSDSQLYKQAGNAVTVNVIYEIARRL